MCNGVAGFLCQHAPGVCSRSSPESGFWPGVKKKDSNFGHVLFLDCTLSVVLRGFGQQTVLACLQFCLYTIVHLLLEEFKTKYTISMSHNKSESWNPDFLGSESRVLNFLTLECESESHKE